MTKEDFLKVHLCKTCEHKISGCMWDFCYEQNVCINYQSNEYCYTSEEKVISDGCNIVKKCSEYKEKKCV